MKIKPLERYLSEFLIVARQSEYEYTQAVAAEQYFEDAAQDLFHAAEFAPELLPNDTLKPLITSIRRERREAKLELQGAEVWKVWSIENKTALNKLDQVLGQLRKIMKYETQTYRFRTDIVARKDTYLDTRYKPEYEQLKMEGF